MTRAALNAGILALFAAMLVGPMLSHPAYSSVSHTTSELAGQNMPGAWVMRCGFVLYGLGAIIVSLPGLARQPLTDAPVLLFGLGLLGVATWSNLPIDPALDGDPAEDRLHSLLASGMGFAFAAACAGRLFLPGGRPTDPVGWLGLIASVVLPLGMLAWPGIDGAIQRVMFAISALWLWRAYGGARVRA